MMTPQQAAHRAQAAEYDQRALTARTRHASRSYRRLAREHRLQAIIAGMGMQS